MCRQPKALAIAGVLMLAACGRGGDARPEDAAIHVSAAVSLSNVLETISADYERATGRRVTLNLGPSNALARQILEGARVDLFVSADAAQLDLVQRAGRVAQTGRVDLLANQLAVVAAPDGPVLDDPRDLLAEGIRRIAIGDPAAVPAGVYARQYLERISLWSALGARLVPVGSVRAALAAVETGAADAAFVYRTDAAVARRARLAFVVPPGEGPEIRYPAAVIAGRNEAAARAFLAYLQGPAAAARFEKAGFVPLTRGGASQP
jgi:molybdate transport system substrate-binding protein